MYKLFLDDERLPQSALQQGLIDKDHDLYTNDLSWIIVRDFDEFKKEVLQRGVPAYVSFDHDLAEISYSMGKSYVRFKEQTGYDCAVWLYCFCYERGFAPPKCQVHSASETGRPRIKQFLRTIGW